MPRLNDDFPMFRSRHHHDTKYELWMRMSSTEKEEERRGKTPAALHDMNALHRIKYVAY